MSSKTWRLSLAAHIALTIVLAAPWGDGHSSRSAPDRYGSGIWISSGQTDLTSAALSSSLWAIFKRAGSRKFRGIGRFCGGQLC